MQTPGGAAVEQRPAFFAAHWPCATVHEVAAGQAGSLHHKGAPALGYGVTAVTLACRHGRERLRPCIQTGRPGAAQAKILNLAHNTPESDAATNLGLRLGTTGLFQKEIHAGFSY